MYNGLVVNVRLQFVLQLKPSVFLCLVILIRAARPALPPPPPPLTPPPRLQRD